MRISNTKRYVTLCIIFCLFAIGFTVLYSLKVVPNLDLFLTVIYVSYFVGIALLYNGGYTKEKSKYGSSVTNFGFGVAFTIFSAVMLTLGLIYGLITIF